MSDEKQDEKNDQKNEKQDHLSNFINESEKNPNANFLSHSDPNQMGSSQRRKVNEIKLNDEWINIPLTDLPYGKFYKTGTRISVRPTTTKEIQAFSIVNEENPYDVQLKMNELLASCVKILFIDETLGTFKDLQEGDRNTIIVILSKISLKHGRKNEKDIFCDCSMNKDGQKVELIPANYVYIQENEQIAEYFDETYKVYDFPLTIDDTDIDYRLAPPTIGLAEDINNYIFQKTHESKGKILPNIPFIQCIGYMKAGLGVKTLTFEQIEQEEFNFQKMNPEIFEFVYDTIKLISFGVEKIKTECVSCRKELTTPFTFPDGPRALFIVRDAFKKFIRQRI